MGGNGEVGSRRHCRLGREELFFWGARWGRRPATASVSPRACDSPAFASQANGESGRAGEAMAAGWVGAGEAMGIEVKFFGRGVFK